MKTLARKLAAALLVTAILAGSAPPAFADTNLAAGGTAVVAYTGGELVKVRAGTGTDFDALTSAPEGATVTIIAGPFTSLDGSLWYGLDYNGTVGYIAADFLATPENAPFIAAATTSSSGGSSAHGSIITTPDGTGARMRDSAGISAAIVTLIAENTPVQVVGSPLNSDGYAWYPINYNGYSGFVAGDFLGSGSGAPASSVAQAAPRGTPSLEAGAHVAVSNTGGWDLRIRDGYNLDSGIVGHAAPDTVLSVLDGPFWDAAGNSWYSVDYDGVAGYASASYLSWTSSDLSARQSIAAATAPEAPAAAPAPMVQAASVSAPAPVVASAPAPAAAAPAAAPAPAPVAAAPARDTSHGQAMVNVAMRYLGYPYAWGGASPGGFDCSGFTAYVANQAFGAKLSHIVSDQIGAGTAVSSKDLQPGDLVFFVNTYEPGLSHVGIYIGGGQMIHAGSENTGVVVSNIWDSYWGPKFYGARRL